MSCVVRWWDVLFVKGMHFSSKNARLLNYYSHVQTAASRYDRSEYNDLGWIQDETDLDRYKLAQEVVLRTEVECDEARLQGKHQFWKYHFQ